MRHFRAYPPSASPFTCAHILCVFPGPEVERRITQFRQLNGPVMFGGQMLKDVKDSTLALPDNLGGNLTEVSDRLVEAPNPHA